MGKWPAVATVRHGCGGHCRRGRRGCRDLSEKMRGCLNAAPASSLIASALSVFLHRSPAHRDNPRAETQRQVGSNADCPHQTLDGAIRLALQRRRALRRPHIGCLEPVGTRVGMDADAFGGAIIHRDEHRSQPLTGERGRQIGAPHGVGRLGDDRTAKRANAASSGQRASAIVAAWAARRTHASWCQQVILAHQPEHPTQRHADTGAPQPRPDLAMSFAVEGTGGEHGSDRCRQIFIGHRPHWFAPLWRRIGRRRLMAIHPGTSEPPDATDLRQAIRLPEPNDARVRLRVTLPARFAVIPFSGLTGPDDASATTAELSAWMQHRLFAMPVPLLSLNTIRRKAYVSPERQTLQRTSEGPNVCDGSRGDGDHERITE